MEPPPIPPDEPERLEALRSYGILDTEREPEYDDVTALAAHICEAPFSLVTLVDEDRQWFKARFGWNSDESDRAISFCAHAICANDLMLVPNAAADPRFSGNPDVVAGPRLRFYAGAPLRSPEGHALGTLCVLDQVPRTLTPDQEQGLRVLARHVMTLLELRRSRRRRDLSEAIVSSLPGVFYLLNAEGHFLRWNRRFEEVTGRTAEEVAEIPAPEFFQGDDRRLIEERIRAVFEDGSGNAEASIVAKDGRATPHYFTGRRVDFGDGPCLVGVGIDLTGRQEAEAERKRLFNLSRDPLCVVDAEGRFRDVNPAWRDTLSYARDELIGRPFLEFVHPDDQAMTREEFERVHEGRATLHFENRYRHRDGGWRWLSWSSSPDLARGLTYAVARDVTEPREVAEALRESEERYRTLVEAARDAILTLSPKGTIASANRAFEAISGWGAAEWLGRPYEELLHPEDRTLARRLFGMADRKKALPVFEIRVQAADGSSFPVEVKAAAFRRNGGSPWIHLAARDIRDRRAMDERLRRIQHLDAVGRMAAGIAHDFNNILGVIRAEAEFIRSGGPLPGEAEDGARNLLDATDRGIELTERLLSVSRQTALRLQPLDLNVLVRGFEPMMKGLIGGDHRVSILLEPGPARVRGDRSKLEQVLMNLVINARDAMVGGGDVRISTDRVLLSGPEAVRLPGTRSGPYVRLSVADSGSGIAPDVFPHIFEPLFTTKGDGEGTGLGLATVHGIVQQHEGWLDVESEPGRGTTFHVYLPEDPEDTPPRDPEPVGPS
jgi:PAS domain S-box-containing protein